MVDLKKLQEKFFNDPDWAMMEELLRSYIDPMLVMRDVDTNQPAEHVKAEIIARTKAYDALDKFLVDARMIKGRALKEPNKQTFA